VIGYHAHRASAEISQEDPPFYALLFALMRKADTEHQNRIKELWPDAYRELWLRTVSPDGLLVEDGEPLIRRILGDDYDAVRPRVASLAGDEGGKVVER
jgi:hypothetical protein